MSGLKRRGLLVELLQRIDEVVVVVVGLDLVERAGELALAILQLLEHRFDGAALFGDFADLLAQRLLAAADVLQPFLHVDGFVAPALQRQPRLGLRQLPVNGGQHILRIVGLKMGDRRVEILLRCGRQYGALFRT